MGKDTCQMPEQDLPQPRKEHQRKRGTRAQKERLGEVDRQRGPFHRVWESIHIVLIISIKFLKQGGYMILSSHEKMGIQWIPLD